MRKKKVLSIVLIIAFVAISVIFYQQSTQQQPGKKNQEEVKVLKAEIEKLKTELEEAKRREQSLLANLTETERKIQELKQDLTEKETQIEALKGELEEAKKEPWRSAATYIFLPIPRKVADKFYWQEVSSFSFNFSTYPSGIVFYTDKHSNNYTIFYWNDEVEEKVTVSMETMVSLMMNVSFINQTGPHPYPLTSVPDDVKIYLQPTKNCPSNDEEIINRAKEIVGNFTDEVKIVDTILYWVSQNIGPWPPTDWLNQINYGIALLRAIGIPARLIFGIQLRPYCSLPYEPDYCQAFTGYWIQVWFPKLGWVPYYQLGWEHYSQSLGHIFCFRGYIELAVMADVSEFYNLTNVKSFEYIWYHQRMKKEGYVFKVWLVINVEP